MKLASFEAVVKALNDAGVRYLVAGGMAVNAHGYLRFTQDIDLVIALEAANLLPAFAALAQLGYRPLVPITASEFADATNRRRWAAEKEMTVLGFHSEQHREAPVDVFVDAPFDFETEYPRALVGELTPGLVTRFVSLDTLIAMKKKAGRPRDQDDIQHLDWIREDHAKYG